MGASVLDSAAVVGDDVNSERPIAFWRNDRDVIDAAVVSNLGSRDAIVAVLVDFFERLLHSRVVRRCVDDEKMSKKKLIGSFAEQIRRL